MTTADPIAEYVSALGRALHGPRRTRRCMVAEARAGLTDAAEAYRAGGVAPDRAAALAVRDFGEVSEIAPSYQDELTARQGRWAAALLALVFPAMVVAWDLLLTSGALPREQGPPTDLVVVLAKVEDTASLVIAAAAAALLATTFRRTARPRRLTRAIGLTGTTGATICGGIPVAMYVVGGRSASHIATSPTTMAAYCTSAAVLVLVVWQSVRTLRMAREEASQTHQPPPA